MQRHKESNQRAVWPRIYAELGRTRAVKSGALPSHQSAELTALLGSGVAVWVGGRPSSLDAASSQTWASCSKDTRTSFAFASRAHLQHSSAIARYSAAVFMKMCPSADLLHVSPSLSALGPTQQRNYEWGYNRGAAKRRPVPRQHADHGCAEQTAVRDSASGPKSWAIH
jgi:hypothetical protein